MAALEIACGFSRDPRCDTFMDINPAIPDLDYCGSFESLPWPDETFDLIVARDCIEHTSYESTGVVLTEWRRVLAPRGRIFIQTPNADLVMEWYIRGRYDLLTDRLPVNLPITPLMGVAWRLLGGHMDDQVVGRDGDWRWNAHYALFSEESLVEHMENAGFVVDSVTTNTHPNVQLWASAPA